ncbi:MAG: valine--tRNA ligase, partial [Actinobacteria bacterium]|nr:valine--tRNA ligase [Actinomycetota bacterium]
LSTMLRLLAPFLPFTCEEVWSWWMDGSVHTSAWPTAEELRATAGLGASTGSPETLAVAGAVLSELRGAKSAAKVGMKAVIQRAEVVDDPVRLELLRSVLDDLTEAGRVEEFVLNEGAELSVTCTLAASA